MKRFSLVLVFSLFFSLCACNGEEAKGLDSILLDGDIIEMQTAGDMVKIDNIRAGLDTYSFETLIYSTADDRVLSQKEFPEDAWSTGCFGSGYYTFSKTTGKLATYSFSGDILAEYEIEKTATIGDAVLSEDGATLLYTDINASCIRLYDLATESEKVIGDLPEQSIPFAARDDRFYLRCASNGELYSVSKSGLLELVFSDPRISFITPDYSLGSTEFNYLALRSRAGSTNVYTPQNSVDEIPIAAYENGFITSSARSGGDMLRVYDVENGKLISVGIDYNISFATMVGDKLMAAEQTDKGYAFHLVTLSGTEKELPLQDTDTHEVNDWAPNPSENTVSRGTLSSAALIKVAHLCQLPEYPTGCESVSAVMLLNHLGVKIRVYEFIDNHLDMSDEFYFQDGVRYGPSPYEYFIGNPRSEASLGCFAPVIVKAMQSAAGDKLQIKNTTGESLDKLCENYIAKGKPCLVWTSMEMRDPEPSTMWTLQNGESFTWQRNEHCMLLVGFDNENYYFNDPYTGKLLGFEKELCRSRYKSYGKQSISID